LLTAGKGERRTSAPGWVQVLVSWASCWSLSWLRRWVPPWWLRLRQEARLRGCRYNGDRRTFAVQKPTITHRDGDGQAVGDARFLKQGDGSRGEEGRAAPRNYIARSGGTARSSTTSLRPGAPSSFPNRGRRGSSPAWDEGLVGLRKIGRPRAAVDPSTRATRPRATRRRDHGDGHAVFGRDLVARPNDKAR